MDGGEVLTLWEHYEPFALLRPTRTILEDGGVQTDWETTGELRGTLTVTERKQSSADGEAAVTQAELLYEADTALSAGQLLRRQYDGRLFRTTGQGTVWRMHTQQERLTGLAPVEGVERLP